MNILLTNYYPVKEGGSQKSTYLLAKALKERGHKVIVASTSNYNKIPTKKFSKFFLPLPSTQIHKLTAFFEKIIEEEKIDLVHAQERLTSFAAVKASEQKKVPCVVHFRDYWFACTNSTCLTKKLEPWSGDFSDYTKSFPIYRIPWELFKAKEIEKKFYLLKSAKAKIALSAAVKQKLESKGINDSVVVPNFVEETKPKTDSEKLRKILGLKEKVVLFVGRFSYEKGVFVFLKAAKKVLEKRKDTSFVLVGDGPLKEKARMNGAHPDIKFLDEVNFEEIGSYYNAADIVVVPSFMEAFGRVAVEAFSFQKPVIATIQSGLADIVKNNYNGLTFKAGDFKELKEKIEELLKDSVKAKKLGQMGFSDFREKFSKESVVKKIEEIYQRVLGE